MQLTLLYLLLRVFFDD